ncbi:hypothetical protein BSK66_08995 [Paenibacillus odorifer]|uniref:Uncharacterized protein n=1 Tax=Paenibacillus odorifer TaxID=189426 RepID=A0A1R0XEG5_9BACL|nr:hypothetical protein C171_22486 [Paenibacillus sp. FSL H8-237]OMD16890.1 hypothetical protein BJP47_19435 [Paenibacillus odorifer]OMD33436.1 hypothetical protein BJP51_11600 [Paenibacillus odorifer]OME25379.1 hypothetical protein BSK57_12290 [Paenibacillus odorifer]OME31152.1 hypothetical protein BSK63_15930 [Paenibacillus odorifer]
MIQSIWKKKDARSKSNKLYITKLSKHWNQNIEYILIRRHLHVSVVNSQSVWFYDRINFISSIWEKDVPVQKIMDDILSKLKKKRMSILTA